MLYDLVVTLARCTIKNREGLEAELRITEVSGLDLVVAHSMTTNAQTPPTANYLPAPGSTRRFATFKMTTLMMNAAQMRNDNDYQGLLNEWVAKWQGRQRLSRPHQLFSWVDDRGRNTRRR